MYNLRIQLLAKDQYARMAFICLYMQPVPLMPVVSPGKFPSPSLIRSLPEGGCVQPMFPSVWHCQHACPITSSTYEGLFRH